MSTEHTVVLSPGHPNADGRFTTWGHDGTYIGAQYRVDAATELMRQRPDSTFWLVGGCNIDGFFDAFSDKARAMSTFICNELKEEEPEAWRRLPEVASLPCTFHNFVAVFNQFARTNKHDSSLQLELTVLTNEYHIRRSRAAAISALDATTRGYPRTANNQVRVQWLAAESILGLSIDDIAKENPAAYLKRLRMEDKGANAFFYKTYEDACRHKYASRLGPLLRSSRGQDLLTAAESESFGIFSPL